MGSMSIWHWLIVLVVVLLIFGTKKLRNIGQDLGGAVKGFKEGVKGAEDAADAAKESAAPAAKIGGTTIEGEVKKERTPAELTAGFRAPRGALRRPLRKRNVRRRHQRDHGHRGRRADRAWPGKAAEDRAHAGPPLRPAATLRRRGEGRHQPRARARGPEEAAGGSEYRRHRFPDVDVRDGEGSGRRTSATSKRASMPRRPARPPPAPESGATPAAERGAAPAPKEAQRLEPAPESLPPARAEPVPRDTPQQASLPGFDRG